MIGRQMTEDKCRHYAHEFRMMSGVMAKISKEWFEARMLEEGYEISVLQFGVLRMLSMDGDHSLSELSKKFMLDPSTLVPTVDSLERKKIVTRLRDPDDRRRVVIGLTDIGREIVSHFDVFHHNDPVYLSMVAMGEAQSEQLMVLLRNLIQHMPEGEPILESIWNRMRMSQEK